MQREYKELDFAQAVRGPIAHLWGNPDYSAEEKGDGWRIQLQINKASRLYAITRGNEEVGKNISHLSPRIDCGNLGLTVLDGELIPAKGSEFHSLAGIRAGNVRNVSYKVFDILYLNGIDVRALPLKKRRELLTVTLNTVYPNHPFVAPMKRADTDTYKFLMQQLLDGGEGVILKNINSTYGAPNSWIKAKRSSNVDVIITGFAPGYDTPCGAVFISVCDGDTLRDVGKVGVLDPEVRANINKNPLAYVGKVIEIKCLKYDSDSGKLREPIFHRLREDISAKDATWDKLQRDLMKIELE